MFVDEKAAGEQQELRQRITRMSQAIRAGCLLAPRQARRLYHDRQGGACAIGAAMLVFGLDGARGGAYDELRKLTNIPAGLHGEIAHRNDEEGWTREQIADWLESQGY